jgi:hypothetical protein
VAWGDLNGAMERIAEGSQSQMTARRRRPPSGFFISFLKPTSGEGRSSPASLTRNCSQFQSYQALSDRRKDLTTVAKRSGWS